MPNQSLAYVLAFCSTLSFSLGAIIFTDYTRKTSSFWVNGYKALVATVACVFFLTLFWQWSPINIQGLLFFLASGAVGLCLGDIFMLRAFADLGASRTLMIYGLQPIFVGLASYFVFGQSFSLTKALGVLFFLSCLLTISVENYRRHGHWGINGLVQALFFILMDSTGVILSRLAFDLNPFVAPLEGHLIRCLAAVGGFLVIGFFRPIGWFSRMKTWPIKEKLWVTMGCFLGTFLSLAFFMTAVRIGHLGSISAVAVTGPLFTGALECSIQRRWPSRYQLIAFLFFLAGFSIVIFSS